ARPAFGVLHDWRLRTTHQQYVSLSQLNHREAKVHFQRLRLPLTLRGYSRQTVADVAPRFGPLRQTPPVRNAQVSQGRRARLRLPRTASRPNARLRFRMTWTRGRARVDVETRPRLRAQSP